MVDHLSDSKENRSLSSEGWEGDLKVKVGLQHGSVHCCLLLYPVSREVVYIPSFCIH